MKPFELKISGEIRASCAFSRQPTKKRKQSSHILVDALRGYNILVRRVNGSWIGKKGSRSAFSINSTNLHTVWCRCPRPQADNDATAAMGLCLNAGVRKNESTGCEAPLCYHESIGHISKWRQLTNCLASCTLLVARGGPLGTGISRSAKFGRFGFEKRPSAALKRSAYECMPSLSCYLLPSANWRLTNWSKYVQVHSGSFGFWHISEALRHARDPNYEGTTKHSMGVPR